VAEPFLGEIRIMSFGFAPTGWAKCDGTVLGVGQNQALYTLLGTTFGGNGLSNFALPDLRARVPIHVGANHPLGQSGGAAAHTLSTAELPRHVHALHASSTNADAVSPTDNVHARSSRLYGSAAQLTALDPSSNGTTGGSQAHLNMAPYLSLNFCISLDGIYPSAG